VTSENVQLVRQLYEAWNEGGPHEAKRYWTEDYEWHDAPSLPDPKVVRGKEEVAAHLAELRAMVGGLRVALKDVREAPDDVVVALLELEVQGAQSGVSVSSQIGQVSKIADGRARWTRAFRSWEEALREAGLSG
jgi:ketosteroid isomerase-like protein